MTTEISNLSSANGASLQLSDKSGQVAAQLLSSSVEEDNVTPQNELEPKYKGIQKVQDLTDIENQVQNLQEFGKLQGWTVNFSLEQDLGQVVIKVMDTDTRSVIRQIPSEELLAIHKRIQALRQGEAGASPKLGLLLDREI